MSEAITLVGDPPPGIPILDDSGIKLSVLSREVAVNGWNVISPFLNRVFDFSAGRLDLEATRKVVEEGLAEVLLVWDPKVSRVYAVIIAEPKIYPGRRVYSLGVCEGSNIHLWAEKIWPALQATAVEQGFDQIEVVGRRGWKRFIPGAEEIATFYAMDLDTEEVNDG